MKKIVIMIIIVLLAFLFAFAGETDSPQKSIVPAKAKWMIHFDMQKFTGTRIYSRLMEDDGMAKLRSQNKKVAEKYGIDVLKDLKSVTLFGAGKKEEETVILARGKLDKSSLLGLLEDMDTHEEISYGGHTIHKWDDGDFGVFSGDEMIIFSENLESIKSVLDVLTGKAQNITSSWGSVMDDLLKNAFISASVQDVSHLIGADDDHPVVIRKMGLAKFALAEEGNNVTMKIAFTTPSPKDAEKVKQVIRGLIALGELQKDRIHPEFKLPEDIQISLEGNLVDIKVVYATDFILKVLSKGLGLRSMMDVF